MNTENDVPSFDHHFPDLNQFIFRLVDLYKQEKIRSWEDLEQWVNDFFTPSKMEQMESALPGCQKMACYAEGVTLVHVMCVFLGLYMMAEFLHLNSDQQNLMKWVILFHDLEKEAKNGKRDHLHAFRSVVTTAGLLPKFGFAASSKYDAIIDAWSTFTRTASTKLAGQAGDFQDNRKIPEILDGIEHMFGYDEPAALIIKTVLFHLSVNGNEWPPQTPLSDEEAQRYFNRELLPLLKVMNLGDAAGWALFDPPSHERLRTDAINAFNQLDTIINR